MTKVTFEGTVEAYQGKALPTPINFSGEVTQYENLTEAQGSEDWPSANEILKIVNTKRVTSAKAAEYQKATAELKKAYEGSVDFKRNAFIKAAIAGGMNTAQAEAMADSIPGLKVA